MATLAAAVRPFAGGVPPRAAPAPSDASERASGKKLRRVAPARDTSLCLAGVEESLYVPVVQKRKMVTCSRNNGETAGGGTKVLTVGGEMSARDLLQQRLASELDALHGLLKKAELISRRGACNGGAPADGKKERRLLASNSKERSGPIEDGGGNALSVTRRKISTLVGQKKTRAPRMSAEERNQLACRLTSLSGELPEHIVEFLQKQFGDADTHGEIEINIDSVEDSVLFELKTLLDKFAQERPIVDVLPEEEDEELADESKSNGILGQQVKTGSRPRSRSSSNDPDTDGDSACERCSDEFPSLPKQITATSAQPPSETTPGMAQSGEAKKVQDVQRAAAPKTAVPLAGLIYRAKVRRQLLEMERAALPDETIYPRDLQRLGIAEYGYPSIMRQLGLFLKADDTRRGTVAVDHRT